MQLGISLDPETAFALLLPLPIGAAYCVRVSRLRERGASPSRTHLGAR